MKMRWVVLFLLLSVAVSAATYFRGDTLVMGNVDVNASVVCERSRHTGMVHLQRELSCCIDRDGTGSCSNTEPLLGAGTDGKYLWPTPTFKPSFSHKLMFVGCMGVAVITGEEYKPLLENNNCTQKGRISYCCPADVFPATARTTQKSAVLTGLATKDFKGKNPILVVNENRWKLVMKGIIHDLYVSKAIRTEKERCRLGGGELFNFNEEWGSYFSDTRNYKQGHRVFMFLKPDYEVIPLISWC